MKSDPFAPASSDRHVKNLSREYAQADEGGELAAVELLLRPHQTNAERAAELVPDAEELRRRETLVREFADELEAHGEAENPTLMDLTEAEHVWHNETAEDGEEGSWFWAPAASLDEQPEQAEQAEQADDEPAEEKAPKATEDKPKKAADKKAPPKARRGRRGKLGDALAALDDDK